MRFLDQQKIVSHLLYNLCFLHHLKAGIELSLGDVNTTVIPDVVPHSFYGLTFCILRGKAGGDSAAELLVPFAVHAEILKFLGGRSEVRRWRRSAEKSEELSQEVLALGATGSDRALGFLVAHLALDVVNLKLIWWIHKFVV